MKKGFTLAEIMIALVVIGVITSILLPVAFNNIPNENIMKFKKGNATLAKVINELVTSGEYYKEGDLGIKADGSVVDSTGENLSYLCETICEVLNCKKINCNTMLRTDVTGEMLLSNEILNDLLETIQTEEGRIRTVTDETIEKGKKFLDNQCKIGAMKMGKEITTPDNIVYYKVGANSLGAGSQGVRYFAGGNKANIKDKNGFGIVYKIFCMDIDGFDEAKGSENCDDVNDVCPFGYGIRADGKIILGKRATEWLEKSIQDK